MFFKENIETLLGVVVRPDTVLLCKRRRVYVYYRHNMFLRK